MVNVCSKCGVEGMATVVHACDSMPDQRPNVPVATAPPVELVDLRRRVVALETAVRLLVDGG